MIARIKPIINIILILIIALMFGLTSRPQASPRPVEQVVMTWPRDVDSIININLAAGRLVIDRWEA